MTANGWLQIAVYGLVILAVTKPLGTYMFRVFEGDRKPLPRVAGLLERAIYRLSGVDPEGEQSWQRYTLALLVFSGVTLLVTYAILRLQHVLPLNPQGLGPVAPDLAFNTSASFTTNTNWQSYGGESTMSYLSQMAGLAWHNFLSAGAGIGVALALVLVSQGVIQNVSPYADVTTLEGAKQTIALGPVASQEAIKELGTNGGGSSTRTAPIRSRTRRRSRTSSRCC